MATVSARRGPSLVLSLVQLGRPRQWLRNVLVAAVPIAAGTILHRDVLVATAQAFLAFTLAASATYCLNDVLDADADARHPTKRNRPVASGRVTPLQAVAAAALLALAAVAVSGSGSLRWVVTGYLVLSVAYSTALKHQAVLELALVSAGFLLRAIAGGAATGTSISRWFLIVTGFASLFVVIGKRLSELVSVGLEDRTRRALGSYTQSYLRMMFGVCGAVTVTAYCLWAFGLGTAPSQGVFAGVSVVPLVLLIMRYSLDADLGRAQEPEQVMLHDHVLQALGAIWFACFWLAAMS
ncbi:decaprenyl-phosphate phosphoribosyltransferase [Terrabacter aerolatus]|uniref:Decaprenyl-phosphate phosphoribosyltransferase n=1 Tax=Terrabacter aerolatus TaxID=422442 RepID=A0A512D4L8_9MICO|nr:decaprenyl-phosphate phosphoribosyltransferase [Terrabacter aerolatus]GEO31415.1 decaprenyl-phosphate phosphoribosyltransferase [Terrabacter aerolatus]